jgi:hypothetical protein
MITVSCAGCGKELHLADAVGGTRVPCPQCGAAVSVPAIANPKRSKTERAMEEALRAMDAKGAARGSRAAPPAATQPASTRVARASGGSIRLKPRHAAITGAAAAAIIIAVLCWNQFTPSTWETQIKAQILQAKQEADQLAAEGKASEAFKKYGTIVLLVSNRPVHDSAVKKAVDDAREARVRLQPSVRQAEEKAKTAGYQR